jgi:hypothetical protein
VTPLASARERLTSIGEERDALTALLGVAAVLHDALPGPPVVVGGTAEQYWTRLPYHATDLDMCASIDDAAARTLVDLGFTKSGRHWWHEAAGVAVEFPAPVIDGDLSRVVVDRGASIIGLDDLYLDRLRQCTADEASTASTEYLSLLAVLATCSDRIDWAYVRRRIGQIRRNETHLAAPMQRIQARARRTVARRLRGSPAAE